MKPTCWERGCGGCVSSTSTCRCHGSVISIRARESMEESTRDYAWNSVRRAIVNNRAIKPSAYLHQANTNNKTHYCQHRRFNKSNKRTTVHLLPVRKQVSLEVNVYKRTRGLRQRRQLPGFGDAALLPDRKPPPPPTISEKPQENQTRAAAVAAAASAATIASQRKVQRRWMRRQNQY